MNTRLVIATAFALTIVGCGDDDEGSSTDSDGSAAVESVSTADGCATLRDRLDDGLFSDVERQGELAQTYRDAKGFATDDIDAHLDVLVKAYGDIAAAVEEAGDEAAQSSEVMEAMAVLNRDTVGDAIVTAHAYFDEVCPPG